MFTLSKIGGAGVAEQHNEAREGVRAADKNIDSNDLMTYNSNFLLFIGDVWLLMRNCLYRGSALIDFSGAGRTLRRGS